MAKYGIDKIISAKFTFADGTESDVTQWFNKCNHHYVVRDGYWICEHCGELKEEADERIWK